MIKSAYHRILRAAAKRGTDRLKFELPGYGYVDQFVRTYCITPPEQRADYLKFAWSAEPYSKALCRYGGLEACFFLVLGDTLLPGFMAANFVSDAVPTPTVRDAANTIIQIGNFVGIPEELVQ